MYITCSQAPAGHELSHRHENRLSPDPQQETFAQPSGFTENGSGEC